MLKVSKVTGVVSAILADDVNGYHTKEDIVVPTYGVQETGNVTRPMVPCVQVQNIDDFDVDLLRHPIAVKASNGPLDLRPIWSIDNSIEPWQNELRSSGWNGNWLNTVRGNWRCVVRCFPPGAMQCSILFISG